MTSHQPHPSCRHSLVPLPVWRQPPIAPASNTVSVDVAAFDPHAELLQLQADGCAVVVPLADVTSPGTGLPYSDRQVAAVDIGPRRNIRDLPPSLNLELVADLLEIHEAGETVSWPPGFSCVDARAFLLDAGLLPR